jgi:hypothetical protein
LAKKERQLIKLHMYVRSKKYVIVSPNGSCLKSQNWPARLFFTTFMCCHRELIFDLFPHALKECKKQVRELSPFVGEKLKGSPFENALQVFNV